MSIFTPHIGLIEAAMPHWLPLPFALRVQVQRDVIAFVIAECALLPWFMAWPFLMLQRVFLVMAWIYQRGQIFTHQTHEQRARSMNCWAKLGMPCQALIRLYRSLVMLAYMEHPIVREAMGLPDQAAHQATKRQQRHALIQVGT